MDLRALVEHWGYWTRLVHGSIAESFPWIIVGCIVQNIKLDLQCGCLVGSLIDIDDLSHRIVRILPLRIIGARIGLLSRDPRHVAIDRNIEAMAG